MVILALDPGEATGWATFKPTGEFVAMGQMKTVKEAQEWLNSYTGPVSVVVVEDYVLFKKRALAQSGSRLPASRVIGAAELFAMQKGAEFVKQPANILDIAVKHSGVPLPSDHSISHQFSAYNHGYYYLVKNGIRKPIAAEMLEKK